MKLGSDVAGTGHADPRSAAAGVQNADRGIVHNIDRSVELIAVDRLAPRKANATPQQVRQIADSITRFGFCNPVLIDDANQIIAGHGRVEAAKLLDLEGVPALRIAHLSEAEKRAYMADNRLAELAGWDREILAIELQGLIDLEFDVELTGFEMGEIDIILDEAEQGRRESAEAEDDTPERVPGPTVSRIGDLWVLGTHRRRETTRQPLL